MKKWIHFIITILCISILAPSMLFAEERTDFELHSIQIYDGLCTISGRHFRQTDCEIQLTLQSGGTSKKMVTTCSMDGGFVFTFVPEYVKYDAEISSEFGKYRIEFDLSEFSDLFTKAQENGYMINSVMFTKGKVTISGCHIGSRNVEVTLRVPDTQGNLHAINQVTSDENGEFRFRFDIGEGEYRILIRAESYPELAADFAVGAFIRQLAVGEADYELLIEKLEDYTDELEKLKALCDEKGIPTDYETAKIAIIKRYISLIRDEAKYDDYTRLGRYDYALKTIYEEAKNDMTAYLCGEKTAMSVPKYITDSSLTFDGTSVLAMTENNGVTEERPVFLSGYGHFESVAKEFPFLRDIGSNIVQIGLNYADVYAAFVSDFISGFRIEKTNGCNAVVEGTTETSHSGTHALKITNANEKQDEVVAELSQKLEVEPDTTYIFGVKAKGDNINDTYILHNWDFDTRKYINASEDWQEWTTEFTTGKFDTETIVRIISENKVDRLYLDDVYVVKKGTDKNLLYDGSFESSLRELTPLEKEVKELGFAINDYGLNKLRRYLESAEQNNIMVDVCLCYNYFEDSMIIKTDPHAKDYYGRFMPFDPQNKTVRKLHSLWARAVGEVVNDYESVNSICILNEPQMFPYTSEAYIPRWQEYLTRKYGNIQALNEAYSSSYQSFEEVLMPSGVVNTPKFYDYRNFNEDNLTEFQEFLVKEVKAACPDKLVHSKIMDFLRYNYDALLINGVDPERLGDLYDINGCDAFAHYRNSNTPFTLKMGWYDYMASIADKPVWDTESHSLTDRNEISYQGIEDTYCAADVWNGALHGRSGMIMWLWDTADNLSHWKDSTWSNSNFRHRPDAVAKMSDASLDLMRLSKEITAIQKADTKIGILMSRIDMGYGKTHMNTLGAAYEEIIFNGQKAGFVTDTQPENMHKYELLVVPEATHVKADMLQNIKKYIESGGKLLILGQNSLKYNEYNKPHDTELIEFIYRNAEEYESVASAIQNMKLSEVLLVDAQTGENPDGVEWAYAEYDGKVVVNILNYDFENTRNLKLYYQDNEITAMTELRDMEKVKDKITAKPYEPILIAFDIFNFDLLDSDGNVIEKDVEGIRQGELRCNAEPKGTLILALYKDGNLIKMSVGKGTIEIPELRKGSYRLMAADWKMDMMKPLAMCRNIETEVE